MIVGDHEEFLRVLADGFHSLRPALQFCTCVEIVGALVALFRMGLFLVIAPIARQTALPRCVVAGGEGRKWAFARRHCGTGFRLAIAQDGCRTGVEKKLVRAVTENYRALKFKDQRFE